jgi:hypothetical protein
VEIGPLVLKFDCELGPQIGRTIIFGDRGKGLVAMCGIAGLIDPNLAAQPEALQSSARDMANAIAHRGPDGEGVWIDAAIGVAISHRRLAIIDLSEAGA